MSAVEFWRGDFGKDYTERHRDDEIEPHIRLWSEILTYFGHPTSFLEIGAGGGANLRALRVLSENQIKLTAVEPSGVARQILAFRGFDVADGTAANPGRTADLVFASGVLIHVHPDELMAACQGIYDAAERYIVSIEYFAAEPEEKVYRGHVGKLWKRDFGGYWLDHFPSLTPLGCGFAWKRMTGLDDVTWWAFEK